ncbi:MAG: hypothetical protein KDA60_22645, partial [Planctomycetales bacterium]|nr:hypothetical protein [Planctomycetales bacterium]
MKRRPGSWYGWKSPFSSKRDERRRRKQLRHTRASHLETLEERHLLAFDVLIDNSDAGFAASAGWTSTSHGVTENDEYLLTSSNASAYATWTFDGLTAGRYQVAASWLSGANRSRSADYLIYDGTETSGTLASEAQVFQKNPAVANEVTGEGVALQYLGEPVPIESDTLVVKLWGDASWQVVADAVSIERIGDLLEYDPTQTVRIMDNGDPGFTASNSGWNWGIVTQYGGDTDGMAAGTGASDAIWNFTNLIPGQYQVSASWMPHSSRTTAAAYTIKSDGVVISTPPTVNQRNAPASNAVAANMIGGTVNFQNLGSAVTIGGNSLE